MAHQLPELGYSNDALEPFIDARTMEIHHQKHHATYVSKLNDALEKHPDVQKLAIEELMQNLGKVPETVRSAVRNNGGGHCNHTYFWKWLKKDIKFKGDVADAIKSTFGGLEGFQEKFKAAALGQFGSGWAWLVADHGKLTVVSTPNQDNPFMDGKKPILGLDVWEHAYYLKYQNRRPDYVDAFFNVINWDEVNRLFVASQQAVGAR
jgi:Fe-Mn family superoxide dismutase